VCCRSPIRGGLGGERDPLRILPRSPEEIPLDPDLWPYLAVAAGTLALLLAAMRARQVLAAPHGSDRMREIAVAIRQGSMAFLRREYAWVGVFVLAMAGLISVLLPHGRPWGAIAFIAGAALSGGAGVIGMRIASAANVRTAEAARRGGVRQALPLAFRGGSVVGFTVSGVALAGFGLGFLAFTKWLEVDEPYRVLTAMALGGSSIALFARVGGGIYTKAADVGAQLVDKTESTIPEDDPRNPAVIADRVGDNVGGVAGMGADLFESYGGALVAPIAFAALNFGGRGYLGAAIMFPLAIAVLGMGASIIGSFLVRPTGNNLGAALHRGTYVAVGLTAAGSIGPVHWLFGGAPDIDELGLFLVVLIGLAVGLAIAQLTGMFTSDHWRPVKNIARQADTGPATVALAGIADGMRSAAYSVLVVAAGIVGAYWAGGMALASGGGIYGIAIAAIAMSSTLGITVSVDALGPIADNAAGIAQMSPLPEETQMATEALGSLGKATAAVAKGCAIGSAAVTTLALLFTFGAAVGLSAVDVLHVETMIGLLLGAAFPFLFSALVIKAVGRTANEMIEEVRRQFREISGLGDGRADARADYARCVGITTSAALWAMLLPGALTVVLPLAIGFIDVEALAGFLAGALVTGTLLAMFMANAGGAWDNARRLIEAGAYGGRGSGAHEAAVIGDAIGHPFKDTAGPALNVVIKLMTIISLVFASAFL